MDVQPLHELDLRRLETSPGASLVVVTSAGCGACRAVMRALAELPAGVVDRAFVVDAHDSAGYVADLEIFHLPALLLYIDGELHAPVDAEPRVAALVAAITAARPAT